MPMFIRDGEGKGVKWVGGERGGVKEKQSKKGKAKRRGRLTKFMIKTIIQYGIQEI